jgi:hypothetical protein
MSTLYISGPMVDLGAQNIRTFDDMTTQLYEIGHRVCNSWPIRHDISQCVRMMTYCDGIYMLPHWQNDQHSVNEHRLANWLGLHVVYAPVPDTPVQPQLILETRFGTCRFCQTTTKRADSHGFNCCHDQDWTKYD